MRRAGTERVPTAQTPRHPREPPPRHGAGSPAPPWSRVESTWAKKKNVAPGGSVPEAVPHDARHRSALGSSGTGPKRGSRAGARVQHCRRTCTREARAPAPARPSPPRESSHRPAAGCRRSGRGGSAPARVVPSPWRDAHSQKPRTSPTTLPRIRSSFSPSRSTIGAMVGCSGLRSTACPSRPKRLTVASPSTSATTMSPDWA
jgi:hypothetical protein